MILIATDEAGYGPKLGPLVIVGTAWRVPCSGGSDGPGGRGEDLVRLFGPLREPCSCGESTVVVDDSKAVYKPSGGLEQLHTIFSASLNWCGFPGTSLDEVLLHLADGDLELIRRTPWLISGGDRSFRSPEQTKSLVDAWKASGIDLIDMKARVITAESFNNACEDGRNKSDLLSEATLGLVHCLIAANTAQETEVVVYCDRHGGRRYYAGVLQHVFPDATLRVRCETKQVSSYHLEMTGKRIDVSFTVKGDSFTPVAMSSLHAKYLRERMIESLNGYFASRHRGPEPLKATAGYPVDADRFLKDVAPIIAAENISTRKLVRSR